MVFGPFTLLSDRRGPIAIKLGNGTIEHRKVVWNSKPFPVDGVAHCFARVEEKRRCASCGGYHLHAAVRSLSGKHRDVRWCKEQNDCDCAGLLQPPRI